MPVSPLFVCACPRSGTTLLADLLGSSQDAIALQKTDFKFKGANGQTGERDVARWVGNGDFTLANTDVLDRLQLPVDNKTFYLAAIAAYAEAHSGGKAPRIAVDHSPDNVRCAHILAREFPEARFIHLVRDGRAVYNSVKKLSWGPSTPLAGAQWWATQIAPGLALESSLGSTRVLRVRYEDVVTDPAETLARICAFAEIRYDDAMSRGGGVKLSPYAADVHPNIGQAPMRERLEAWRKTLPEEEHEAFTLMNAALLHWLGYAVPEDRWELRIGAAKRLYWIAAEAWQGRVWNRVRQRSRRRATRVSFDTQQEKDRA